MKVCPGARPGVTELLSSDGSTVCHNSNFEMAPFYNEYFLLCLPVGTVTPQLVPHHKWPPWTIYSMNHNNNNSNLCCCDGPPGPIMAATDGPPLPQEVPSIFQPLQFLE